MLVFLIGYMGCGKTTLGRRLANRLQLPFFDTDTLVEKQEGASVNDIFLYEGEERFRKMERMVIDWVIAQKKTAIVATGGGLPAWSDNMERMNGAGLTIYIHRDAKQIIQRLTPFGRQKRPKLRGLDDQQLLAFMTKDMAERAPFYEQSQCTVEGCFTSDNDLIDTILLNIPKDE
ncbi:MAG: shikimate kinase [Alistipes sp.]